MALESNLHIQEILSALKLADLVPNADSALQKYRKDALAVAKLPIPSEAKERTILGLQDALHDRLAQLLKQEREGVAKQRGRPLR